ncbi:MAG: DUF192 domain-containing protein [Anaerolineaceae bacterium]|nr:DUF192 domain-containing protein [Anaerolineaceae bacterium]
MAYGSAVVINQSRPTVVTIQVEYCASFWKRFKGLMFLPSLDIHSGVLLVEKNASIAASSIHMFFMNFDIAVVWIDEELKVVDTTIAKRWHPYYSSTRPAKFILETHVSHIHDFKNGDQLSLEIF